MPGLTRHDPGQHQPAPAVPPAPVRPEDDGGFVLVSVIWLAGLAAVMCLAFAFQARVHMALARTAVGAAQAEALADAGIMLAVQELHSALVRGGETRGPAHGAVRACSLPDGSLLVTRIENEGGKVDLNTADADLLRALLLGLGVDTESVQRLTAALLARRGPRLQGTRADETGVADQGRHGPLESIGELTAVPGFTAAIVQLLQSHVTVHSGQTGINPASASRELLTAVAAGQERLAAAGGSGWADAPGTHALERRFIGATSYTAYTVTVEASTPRSARFIRQATLSLLPIEPRRSRRRARQGEESGIPTVKARLPTKFWTWRQLYDIDSGMVQMRQHPLPC